MRLDGLTLDHLAQAPFRYRAVGDRVVITNDEGSYALLSHEQFADYAQGTVASDSPLYRELADKNFLRSEYDANRAAERIARRRRFLDFGPNLHMLVVTLRCNETCVYCHASRAEMTAVETDMSRETAEQAVDFIFQTTSPFITIEFQGGEPLVNFDVVQHVIEYALEKNKTANKRIEFTMVSNLAMMTEEKLDYLLEHKVQLCTSVDGPKPLHDKQRVLPMASAFDETSRWIKRINEAYGEKGLDPTLYHVEALLTTTRAALPQWKEIVDTYVSLGCRALFLRPVDPFGFAEKTARLVEYPRVEYLEFYRNAVDYMIELNKQGVEILERYAGIFLTKILTGDDPNFLDVRSPSGAGIGGLAYNYDGGIFISDEGRMLHETGDDMFKLGQLGESRYRDVMLDPTLRSVVIAGNRQAQPDCVNCAYTPYCGVDPIHTYKLQGSIFGRMRENPVCHVHKGIQDYLFDKLAAADEASVEVLTKWTTARPREHFVQD